MSLKEAAANALLMFVAATCVVLIVKAVSPAPTSSGVVSSDAPVQGVTSEIAATPDIADGVYVYYLHGSFRCATCRTIEEFAEESVRSGFPDQLQAGKVHWQVINYEEPENRQFAVDYEVVAPTVVLARFLDGKRVAWEGLPDVWSYVGKKRLFVSYVQGSLREFLGTSPAPAAQAVSAADTSPWNARLPLPTTRE